MLFRFNGKAREGIQALDDIHNRASYELFADVLLVSISSLISSSHYRPPTKLGEGNVFRGISLFKGGMGITRLRSLPRVGSGYPWYQVTSGVGISRRWIYPEGGYVWGMGTHPY